MRPSPESSDASESVKATSNQTDLAQELYQLAKYEIIDFAIILLDESASIISWNAGSEHLFQYTEAEVLGKSADLIFTAEDRRNQQPQIELAGARETGRAEDERWHVRKDGSRFMASGVLTGIRNQQGELRGYAKVLRDITERMKADALLQQARHYDSLAVLAGGIAHDFNNLLTGILGNNSLALDELPTFSPARALLKTAIQSSHRGAELTRSLLAYAGKGRFTSRRLEFSQILSDLRPVLRRSVSNKINLEFSLPGGSPRFLGDPAQIEDLILNIVANAADAMDSQPGRILIASGSEPLDRAQLDSLGAAYAIPGLFVYCEVADQGLGMDEKTVARIFEPFFTTKFLGRGLGLAAVSGIVRQYKGAIRVISLLGKGTTFRVFFPAQPSE